jgi:hypothetical protein
MFLNTHCNARGILLVIDTFETYQASAFIGASAALNVPATQELASGFDRS